MMIEAFVIRCNTHFLSHPWNYHGTESLCLLAELGLVTTGQRVCCLQRLLSFTRADIVCYSYKDTWIHDVRRLFAYMHTWTAILAFHTFIHEYTTSVGCFVYMHNEHKRLSFWLFHECTHDTRREQPVLYTCTMNTRDSHPGFSYIHTWIHDVSRLFCFGTSVFHLNRLVCVCVVSLGTVHRLACVFQAACVQLGVWQSVVCVCVCVCD
jgi:hypothetical protein